MTSAFNGRAAVRFSTLGLLGIACGLPLACGADDQFAAQSNDEYTDPLTNAIIGTPTGVIQIGADGRQTISAASAASAGKAGSGAGGGSSTGSGAAGATSVPPPSGKAGAGAVGSAGNPGFGGSFGDTGATGPAGGGKDPGGGSAGNGALGNFGQWHFDDCSPKSHFLVDSSGLGANAQQALKGNCVAGISGQAVQFKDASDVVQVPDEPQFTVSQHVGVAAWVNPKNVTGDQPIVIKRLNNKTAFSLGIHNGNIEMSVVLKDGTTVISRAPIPAKKWTHVAGMFDGTFVFLFINGQQFGQVYGAGKVRDVFAPIRIGATTDTQFFNGAIDEVFLTTDTITPDVLTSLSCITRPSTLAVTPPTSGPVLPDTSFNYDISLTNNDVGGCQPKVYQVFNQQVDPGLSVNFDNQFAQIAAGAELKVKLTVTGSDEADPGVHTVPFAVNSFSNSPPFSFESLSGQVSYELIAPTGCFVSSRRELMITHPSVVDDPIRTAGSSDGFGGVVIGGGSGGETGEAGAPGEFPPPLGFAGTGGSFGVGGRSGSAGGGNSGPVLPAGGSGGSGPGGGGSGLPAGVWSFGHLMREMAPNPEAAPAFTLKLLQHWLTNQTVNGFNVPAKPLMQQILIDAWPKTANGELDLDQSPLTLQAIVNRIDIRNLSEGSAGEGRFVFGVNGNSFGNFSLILEYNLVAHTAQDVTDWANRWHALGSLPFPSEAYNAALEAVTRRFTDRNASPNSPNGSALVELRTNEFVLSGFSRWELRSFALSPTTGQFDEVTVKETPDLGFNGTAAFANFVNQNAAAIIAEVPGGDSHTVPTRLNGSPFMGGSIFNDQVEWNAPGIKDPDARFHASLNTCNGCHSFSQTGTPNFLMITPRSPGGEAFLSPFITGVTVTDLVTGQPRTLNDLGRRKTDLTSLVCPSPAPQVVAHK